MTKQQLKDRIVYLRKELNEATEQFLIEEFKNFFKNNNSVDTISWTQFSDNSKKNVLHLQYNSYKEPNIKLYVNSYADFSKIQSSVFNIMNSLDEKTMNDIFGEDVKVEINKEGITIEEFVTYGN